VSTSFYKEFGVLLSNTLAERPSQKKTTKMKEQYYRLRTGQSKKVSQDIEAMSFNTAIAALMKFTNELYDINKKDNFSAASASWQFALTALIQLLAPFAPHITEELMELALETPVLFTLAPGQFMTKGILVQSVVQDCRYGEW
jgi:leucyl-tRNA synthetase